MRRGTLPVALSLLLTAAACGPAEVVVTAEIEMPNPEGEGTVVRPIEEMEVQLLPFDRDAVFDSMTAAFPTPEPPIPEDLIAARDEVRRAQEEWQSYQNRWNTLRDTLQKLTETMEQYNRGEAAYRRLFLQWEEFDDEYQQVERQMNRAFERFTELQQGIIRASDSIRILRENWADEAYSGIGEVFAEKVRASGLDVAVDTTDANGIARFRVKPGRYWVHARYELPYTELYWNEPVDVQRGEPVQIRLNRENAEERIKL